MAVAIKNLKALKAVQEQLDWMEKCGGTLTGYIARYGRADDPDKYGDGGEVIYAVDNAELQRRWQALNRLVRVEQGVV